MAVESKRQSERTFGEKAGLAAIVAAASGIVGLLSAIIALYAQVGPAVSAAIKRDFAPIGTVIASVLDPPAFAESIGEREGDSYTKRNWILADGREVIDTAYARTTKNKPVPDLQGVFLRGIDLKNKREPGNLQKFSTARPSNQFTGVTTTNGNHQHADGMKFSPAGDRYNAGGKDYLAVVKGDTSTAGDHMHQLTITGGGDAETRPDNVAIYYYIKIN